MSATPPSIVGVAGAPEVAAALREIGFTVITGNTFREAAIAIAAQLKQEPVHVVVETMSEPGFTPWVISTHAKSSGVILLPTSDAVDVTGQLAGVPRLDLPATVNDLLVQMNASPALAEAGELVISGAHPETAPESAPALETAPAVPVASPAPVVAAAPAPSSSPSDPFAALMAQAASPTVTQGAAAAADAETPDASTSAPVTDPFATPAVTDPFAGAAETPIPSVSDPFEQVLAAIPAPDAPSVVAPAEVEMPAPAPAPALGVPNPMVPASAPVSDPFAASTVTGEEAAAPADDFLAAIARVSTAEPAPASEHLPYAEAPGIPVGPTPSPAPAPAPAPMPVPAPAVNIPAVREQELRTPVSPLPHPAAFPADPTPQPQSEFIRQVLARQQVRPQAPAPAASWAPAPAPAPDAPAEFFPGAGISAGGCQVIVSLAGKGGAGKTTQTLMYGQTAGDAGLRVLVIDANRDQGDIGTSLRVEKAGFPTILHAVQGHPGDAIITKEQINAARPAAAQDIQFDVVLAPPREFAGPRYANAQVYARLLAYAKSRYELIVIDTQIIEAQKSDLHTGFIIPELRSGAWSAGIALYDYSAIRNAFAVFDELAALGVTPQRTLVVATRWPERESDTERFLAQFGQYGTFVGFVGDDPNVNAQKSVGNLLIGSPAIAPVVRTLLHRVTNKPAFAPIEDGGKRRRRKAAPAAEQKSTRRGLFGGRR